MASLTKTLALLASSVSVVYGLFPATGVQGNTYPRYEIRDLHANHPEQWSLYIQALKAFQEDDSSETGSYWQLSGIHGLPNVPWDGVTGNGGGTGYCNHGVGTFPVWHRPYVAVFEQQLQAHAVTIANTYPDSNRQTYVDAANQLRQPYLDWAINPAPGGNSLPDELVAAGVDITAPSGPTTVYNPLYLDGLNPIPSGFPSPFDSWPNTLRYPNGNNPDASSQMDLAVQTCNQAQPNMRSGVYQLMTNCPNYMDISMDANDGGNDCPWSLESLHNSFHMNVGGAGSQNGHMCVVPVSAYDPVFMLHHTQVDRLFAIWQVMNPNSYIQNEASPVSTYYFAQGTTVGPDSPLAPFRDTNGNFWTATTARSTDTFHYTYPELQQANGDGNTMFGIVNNLYGSGSATAARKAKRSFGQKFEKTTAKRQLDLAKNLLAGNGSSWEYNANIVTSKYALGDSYVIYIFFGNPITSDPNAWGRDKNLAGSYGVFASMFQKANVVTRSGVSLTDALRQKVSSGEIASLDPVDVTPYLTKNIQWRILGPDGKEVQPSAIPNFSVGVYSSTLAPVTGLLSELTHPLWSAFNLLADVTKGKAGGISL